MIDSENLLSLVEKLKMIEDWEKKILALEGTVERLRESIEGEKENCRELCSKMGIPHDSLSFPTAEMESVSEPPRFVGVEPIFESDNSDMRADHAIIEFLRSNGPKTRPEIAEGIGSSARYVTRVIEKLGLRSVYNPDPMARFAVVSGRIGKGSHIEPAVIWFNEDHPEYEL